MADGDVADQTSSSPTPSPSPSPSQPIPFLKFPREIRDLIYGLLLHGPSRRIQFIPECLGDFTRDPSIPRLGRVDPLDRRKFDFPQFDNGVTDRPTFEPHRLNHSHHLAVALLRTCKQIYNEARSVLYHGNHFEYFIGSRSIYLRDGLDRPTLKFDNTPPAVLRCHTLNLILRIPHLPSDLPDSNLPRQSVTRKKILEFVERALEIDAAERQDEEQEKGQMSANANHQDQRTGQNRRRRLRIFEARLVDLAAPLEEVDGEHVEKVTAQAMHLFKPLEAVMDVEYVTINDRQECVQWRIGWFAAYLARTRPWV